MEYHRYNHLDNISRTQGLKAGERVQDPLPAVDVLAKANFHFAQEATLIYILEVSLNKTYAQSKL